MRNLTYLFVILLGSFVSAQTIVNAVSKDTIQLNLESSNYNGTLQWQKSINSTDWENILGATKDPYKHIIDQTPSYYRAKFSSQSCNYFSETITVIDTLETGYIEESIADIDATPELVHVYSNNLPTQRLLDMPPVKNQGNQGSCSAWAVSYYLMGYLKHEAEQTSYYKKGGNIDNSVLCSPAYTFNQVKESDRDDDCSGSGAIQHLTKLKSQGVCSLNEMPYIASDCSTLPTENQIALAAKNKISQYFKINRDNIQLLKTVIALGKPLVFAISSNSELKKLKSPYIWTPGDTGSGHSVTMCGYSDSLEQFRIINSWGSNWGNNGFFDMTYNGFRSLPNGKDCFTAFWKSNPEFNNLPLNLDHHYLFDGNGNDEKGETTTITNNTISSTDRKGIVQKSLLFNGTDSYFQTSESINSNAFSVSLWINPKSNPIKTQTIFSQINKQLAPTSGLELSIVNDTITLSVPTDADHIDLKATSTIISDNWYHLAITYDGNFIRLYINGIPVKIGVYNTFFNTTDPLFTVGCQKANSNGKKTNFFTGKIDDVRIYSRNINDAEVEELFNQ